MRKRRRYNRLCRIGIAALIAYAAAWLFAGYKIAVLVKELVNG